MRHSVECERGDVKALRKDRELKDERGKEERRKMKEKRGD